MTPPTQIMEQVEALEAGVGFVDRSSARKLRVRGTDAVAWLGGLTTADVATLHDGHARRSLILTPTGRIRADVSILVVDDGLLLLQDDDQPEAIADVLAPFVLSSAVELVDETERLGALAFPPGSRVVVVASGDLPKLEAGLAALGHRKVDDEAAEIARVRRGHPRMGVDFETGALPAEAGLDAGIDPSKGCFLGQEAVAKVRNLGHPPTCLRRLRSPEPLARSAPVHTSGGVVGTVTSSAPAADGGWVLLARVDWEAAEADLHSPAGIPLGPVED